MKIHQSFQQKYWGMSSLLLRSRAVCAISQQKPTPVSKANRRRFYRKYIQKQRAFK
jgi:hypothetical protein